MVQYKFSFLLVFFYVFLLLSFSAASLEIYSPWIQGGMVIGKTDPKNKIRFLGKSVRVDQQGQFVVGLGRNAKSSVELEETLASGEVLKHRFDVVQRKYKEQRIEGVPKRTVDIPEAELPRIRSESALVKKARTIDSLQNSFSQTFQWPTTGIISGVYGSRRVYNDKPRRPHYGVDIAAPQGTIVKAPIDGKVTLVHKDMFFSGGTLIVDHGHGISSTFIHLHKILVNEGDVIKQGDPIAEVGSTGRSTGPHLHWGMNWFQHRLDPQLLVEGLPPKN